MDTLVATLLHELALLKRHVAATESDYTALLAEKQGLAEEVERLRWIAEAREVEHQRLVEEGRAFAEARDIMSSWGGPGSDSADLLLNIARAVISGALQPGALLSGGGGGGGPGQAARHQAQLAQLRRVLHPPQHRRAASGSAQEGKGGRAARGKELRG